MSFVASSPIISTLLLYLVYLLLHFTYPSRVSSVTKMGLKDKLLKIKYYLTGEPIKGETYKDAPRVQDLPHMKDADGNLIAVSSGDRELSPVLSAKLNIQNSHRRPDPEGDDTIEGALSK
ncbi:LADA_0G05314g1_1 [Lachancea dasiensis]|uniref:LADA_0G05314g1_1 n=1 Tax=Lachancea dasiensis TaxID=1072105 RepID=A0A1G4JSL9_9SACH|nr:LADA_0G05314g1_1 [Lachancea dasiensis]